MKKLGCMMMALLLLVGCSSNETPSGKAVLKVGMECNYAPFNWTDTKQTDQNIAISAGGYCDGYDVAIAKNIADQLDMDLEVYKMEWDALIPSVQNGQIDLIIAGMTDTAERRENLDFTSQYYQSQMTMIVRSDGQYVEATSLEDFRGATIQGQLSTLYDTVIDEIPEVNHAQALDSYPLLIASLLNGASDGVTAETPVGQAWVATSNGALSLVEFDAENGFQIDLSDTSVSIGLKKGNTELLDEISNALANISEEDRDQMMKDAASRQPIAAE